MNRDELARELSERVRRVRLARIGDPTPAPGAPFEELPQEDQQTWLDVADAALDTLLEVREEWEAIAFAEAVLRWAHAEPDMTAYGGATGETAQRGRVIATRVLPEGTVGLSTYPTVADAAGKIAELDRMWRKMLDDDGQGRHPDDRTVEKKLGIPEDFGGLAGIWAEGYGIMLRAGHGKIIEAMRFTPLNALQARRTLEHLISAGKERGEITAEHERQSAELPTMPLAEAGPRENVDRIAGPE